MSNKIFVNDLEIEALIGIFDWEREVKQLIRNLHKKRPTNCNVVEYVVVLAIIIIIINFITLTLLQQHIILLFCISFIIIFIIKFSSRRL